MRVRFLCAPDEESEDVDTRSTDELVARRAAPATSRSPASRPTCTSASRPRACSPSASRCSGRAAHGSTPWLGDNAVLKAIDVFRRIETLPFSRESTELFDRPSINLGRIPGGDALNKVPDQCTMDVDIRYLPGQDPAAILEADPRDPGHRGHADVRARPRPTSRAATRTCSRSCDAVGRSSEGEALSVGRDGASDAVSFLEAGIPAVEFGPVGRGPPRPRGVGLDLLAGALPPRAGATSCARLPDAGLERQAGEPTTPLAAGRWRAALA